MDLPIDQCGNGVQAPIVEAIIQAESGVQGLTTAAALWIVSGVGIAVGAGHYFAAIVVAIVVFIVLLTMRSVEYRLTKKFKNKSSK